MQVEEIESFLTELADIYSAKTSINFRLPVVVGVASVSDPLWDVLRRIHPWHAHPREILPTARSVIVYALPLSREAIESNKRGTRPSKQWLLEYAVANRVLEVLGEKLCELLRSRGHDAVALKPTHEFSSTHLHARWSHRHAGYVAGLGTFGLNNMLITRAGCAVRLASVLTSLRLETTPRPDREYCLAKRGQRCEACVRACPVEAFRDWRLGKYLCYTWLLRIDSMYRSLYGEPVDACGKCIANAVCAYAPPV